MIFTRQPSKMPMSTIREAVPRIFLPASTCTMKFERTSCNRFASLIADFDCSQTPRRKNFTQSLRADFWLTSKSRA